MTVAQPPRPTRRGRPGYDLESLLQVAVRLFNERGYDGTSMEDLSRKLGISKSAIYHHVPSKQELLRLAVDRALDGLFEVADEVHSTPGRAIDRLERLVRGNTEVERVALARRREFDRIVAALVKEAEADGDIRPDIDPSITARLLFGLVNSLIEWYRPGRGTSPAELADAVCKITFDGMRVRASAE